MIEGDDYSVATAGEADAVVDGAIGGAGGVGSSMDVDEDGDACAGRGRVPRYSGEDSLRS